MGVRHGSFAALALAAVLVGATGCQTIPGNPTAGRSESSSSASPRQPTSTTNAPSSSVASAPVGPPVAQATIQVVGTGPVTIRYRVNGGAEQTETNVALPWEKVYDVYDEVETSASIDGGDQLITCSIVMNGLLVAFESEPRPTCSFAYYG